MKDQEGRKRRTFARGNEKRGDEETKRRGQGDKGL